MWDIKAILLYASVAENEFFTRMRSLKARKAARSTNTRTLERTQTHTSMQDLPRHQHSDPRLSVSFQSQTRWMAGEWKSWLKPNPIPLLPSTVWEGEREHPSILLPPLYREGHLPRVIPHFVLSYHPPARIHPSQNTNIYLEDILAIWYIYNIFNYVYNYLTIIMRFCVFI